LGGSFLDDLDIGLKKSKDFQACLEDFAVPVTSGFGRVGRRREDGARGLRHLFFHVFLKKD